MNKQLTKLLAIAVVVMFAFTVIPANIQVSATSETYNLPSVYNLDTDAGYGTVFPVRDQGPYNTCWSFAYSAAIESDLKIKDPNYSTRISPLGMASSMFDGSYNLYTCPSYQNTDKVYCLTGNASVIDTGAFSNNLFYGITSGKAKIINEDEMSYDFATNDTDYSLFSNPVNNYMVKGLEVYDPITDKELIKSKIKDGHIGVLCYVVTASNIGQVSKEYYPYYETNYHNTNHAVALVGWDDSYDKNKFSGNIPANDGAWTIRNSYGTTGTFDGYTHMSYESTCGLVYFVKDTCAIANTSGLNSMYSYDMGISSDKDIITSRNASMANIFTAESDNESLESISFSAYNPNHNTIGERYKVTIYQLSDNTSPVSDRVLAIKSGTITTRGQEHVVLDTPVNLTKGMMFSVVIELSNPEGSVVIPIDTISTDDHFVSYTVANEGESWVKTGTTWSDISVDKKSNVRIKAFTHTDVSGSGNVVGAKDDGSEPVRYTDVATAIDNGANVIVLLTDITFNANLYVSKDYNVSIFLNGHTLRYTGTGTAITSNVSGTTGSNNNMLSIFGGKIQSTGNTIDGKNVYILYSTIICDDSSSYAVNVSQSQQHLMYVTVESGNIAINNGVSSILAAVVKGTVNVGQCRDVYFYGGKYANTILGDGSKTTIDGGDFSNSLTIKTVNNLSIKQGIKLGKTSLTGYVASGSVQTGNGSDGYKVSIAEAKYGNTLYPTIVDAINAGATAIEVIPLGNSHNYIIDNVVMVNTVTIDLKGTNVMVKSPISIPSAKTFKVYNGTMIGYRIFNILDTGILIIGNSTERTELYSYIQSPWNIAPSKCNIQTQSTASTIKWRYTDLSNHRYEMTSTKVIVGTSLGVRAIEMSNTTGIIYDSNKNLLQDTCTSATYYTYVQDGKYRERISLTNSGQTIYNVMTTDYKENGKILVSTEETNCGSFSSYLYSDYVNNNKLNVICEFDDGTRLITGQVSGLRTSTTVSGYDSVLNEMLTYATTDFHPESATTSLIIELWAHEDSFKPVGSQFKVFDQSIINYAKGKGAALSLKIGDKAVYLNPNSVTPGSSILVKSVTNGDANNIQEGVMGDLEGYCVGYLNNEALDSFLMRIIMKEQYSDPAVYLIGINGETTKIDASFSDTECVFKATEPGIYVIAEDGCFVTGTDPIAKTGMRYTGSEQQLVEPATGVSHGIIEYSKDGVTWSTFEPTATNAGSYTVYYRYIATEKGYIGIPMKSFTVTIDKIEVQGTAPVAKTGLEYDGTAKELVEPAKNLKGGHAEYSLDGNSWSKDIPTATEKGNYTVWYKFVSDDNNHTNSEVSSLNVTIKEKSNGGSGSDNTALIIGGVVVVLILLGGGAFFYFKKSGKI